MNSFRRLEGLEELEGLAEEIDKERQELLRKAQDIQACITIADKNISELSS